MKTKILRYFILGICVLLIIFNFVTILGKTGDLYTRADYWSRFKSLENTYNSSQYIKKNPTAIITDNVVYMYNAGRFIQGVNPILVNPEVPTLGKYIIALSILAFNNENIINLLACILLFPLLYILSYLLLKDFLFSVFPPLLFSFEEIFANQVITTPVLDILQLDFLIISFILFVIGLSKKKFNIWFLIASMFFVGLFISTKFFATGVAVLGTFFVTTFLIWRERLLSLILTFIIVPVILVLSYSKLFFLGYNLREVIGVQKWIFHYNTGHLGHPPFVVWDLILFNRWHTWWADNAIISDPQWNILWPATTIISLIVIMLYSKSCIQKRKPIVLIMAWVVLYLLFMSVGQATSRYLFILLPFLSILTVFGILKIVPQIKLRKIGIFVFLVIFSSLFLQFGVRQTHAQANLPASNYVMPYPGIMPGNKLYVVSDLLDKAKSFYTFGDIARFKYNLAQADKYLIESKILFEYNQYPLAIQSLESSNIYYENARRSLESAGKSKKNTSILEQTLSQASLKHAELLSELLKELPAEFLWEDEKKAPLMLEIEKDIKDAIRIRIYK